MTNLGESKWKRVISVHFKPLISAQRSPKVNLEVAPLLKLLSGSSSIILQSLMFFMENPTIFHQSASMAIGGIPIWIIEDNGDNGGIMEVRIIEV